MHYIISFDWKASDCWWEQPIKTSKKKSTHRYTQRNTEHHKCLSFENTDSNEFLLFWEKLIVKEARCTLQCENRHPKRRKNLTVKAVCVPRWSQGFKCMGEWVYVRGWGMKKNDIEWKNKWVGEWTVWGWLREQVGTRDRVSEQTNADTWVSRFLDFNTPSTAWSHLWTNHTWMTYVPRKSKVFNCVLSDLMFHFTLDNFTVQ